MAMSPDPCRTLNHCFCRYSPRVPRIAADGEYACTPADADEEDGPATWSLLAGVMSVTDGRDRSLRLHRLRVATRSGRVLGRSGDALEIFGDDDLYTAKNATSRIRASAAAPVDGSSLSLFLLTQDFDLSDMGRIEPARPLELRLDGLDAGEGGITLSHLPTLPEHVKPLIKHVCPVSAAGELWAPYLTAARHGPPCSLVMLRLDRDSGRWVEAGAAIDVAERPPPWARSTQEDTAVRRIQGSVVIGDATILLSIYLDPQHLFFTFDCSTGAWAKVATTAEAAARTHYTPIRGRGAHVEEDDTIYFLGNNGVVCAYNLFKDDGGYRMDPPTHVDSLFPYPAEGCARLAHLGGRVMSAVWIGVNIRCKCGAKHVRVTTFRVKGGFDQQHRQFVPKGVEVLRSTCRALDVSPSKPSECYGDFIFLQEYEELNHEDATLPAEKKRGEATKTPASSNVVEYSNMLPCCRKFLDGARLSGTIATCERSLIKNNVTLYIICQSASHSTVCKINILDGRLLGCQDEILTPHCTLETFSYHDEEDMLDQPLPTWHFFCDGRLVYAAPSTEGDSVYTCDLFTGCTGQDVSKRPAGVVFHHVLQVGLKTIALSDSFQGVYHLNSDTCEWIFHETFVPPREQRQVNFTGYAVLDFETFIVYEGYSRCCFMLNISDHDGAWKVVMPYAEYETSSQDGTSLSPSLTHRRAYLNGRSVFANGFIYTCLDEGLTAYELIEHCGSHYLGGQIDLQFPWRGGWDDDRICFTYVGEDKSSGAIMFCVLQDDHSYQPGHYNTPVRITTVQVKTERMHNGMLEPKKIGHVDMVKSCVEWSGSVWIRNCFAVCIT